MQLNENNECFLCKISDDSMTFFANFTICQASGMGRVQNRRPLFDLVVYSDHVREISYIF